MLRTAVAIRHVHFEDLGVFEAVLAGVGYRHTTMT
jgi:GMP synthase (glutamine-hydrolysing)